MENRIVKFKSKESAGLNLHAIPGHFASLCALTRIRVHPPGGAYGPYAVVVIHLGERRWSYC